jgi:hypothetical protein
MPVLSLFFNVAEQDAEEEKMQEILGMAFNHKRFVAFSFPSRILQRAIF